jgi:ADP-heptose:LPS heptosyltransferase
MGARTVPVPAGGFTRIAVIRLSSLGDVVLTLPVVHALKRVWPAARLSYWVKEEFQDAVRFDPAIDHVRVLDQDARRIEDLVSMSAELTEADLIVDLHRNTRSRILTWRHKALVLKAASDRLLRWRWVHARWTGPRPASHALARYAHAVAPIGVVPDEVPRLAAGEDAEAWAHTWLAEWQRPGAPVAIAPGAHHFTKRWPEEHWIALDERLEQAGRARLYLSLKSEREQLPALSARVGSQLHARWCSEPLPRMAALLSHCAEAVTGDTGLMHVAAARGVRVTALFGSTSPVLGFSPSGEGHTVLCRNEPCQPCTLHGREACPLGHFRCMRELKPETVYETLAG